MKKYVIYDGRAIHGDTDDAMCMTMCDSLEEARSYKGEWGECAIYSYDVTPKDELINEQFIEIL